MSIEITGAFVQQYHDNVMHLAQQKGSRLRGSVMVENNIVGKSDFVDRIGKSSAQKKTSRHGDTPLVNTPHSRRRLTLTDYEWADLIDKLDQVRLLINPESAYAMAGAWAMGRSMDDEIITAANGTAFGSSGTDDAGATAIALPAAQKIAVAATGLTIAKLRTAAEILDAKEVDPEEPRYIVYSAKQRTNLLATTEVTSSDFNTVKSLVQGQIDTFMGFKFIHSERLAVDASSDRLVLAYTQSAIRLGIGQEIVTRIDPRVDKSYATQVFLCMAIGAVRVEEEKVVEIACDE